MAVFLVNICKFQGCGLKYTTLRDLIQHIEEIHIVSDPKILERQETQQPSSLALSYVLRLSECEKVRVKARQRTSSVSPVPSINSHRSSTPTESEFDDEERKSDAENSDDSWTNQDEFTSELILGMMGSHKQSETDKPFVCPVPGCKKRYKNINGIKYHAKNGHKKDLRVKKPFRCKCGKSYRTASGLRQHSIISHPLTTATTFTLCSEAPKQQSSSYSTSPLLSLPIKATQSMLSLPSNSSVTSIVPSSYSTTTTGAFVSNSKGTAIINPIINGMISSNTISSIATKVNSNKNSSIIPPGATLIPPTVPIGSSRLASLPSLVSTNTNCRTLPPGSLTFAIPSGGLQVAVPVSHVLSLPANLGGIGIAKTAVSNNSCSNIYGESKFGKTQNLDNSNATYMLEDPLDSIGALETVETFTGLDTSIDDTKAD